MRKKSAVKRNREAGRPEKAANEAIQETAANEAVQETAANEAVPETTQDDDERYLRMVEALREQSPRPTSEQLKAELAFETDKKRYRSTLRQTISVLIVVAAASVLLAVFFISVLRVRGDSMSPNLDEGDLVIAVRTQRFEPGDIIAFYYGPSILLKRVVGNPGDIINIDEDGNVFVNGVMLEESYLPEKDSGIYNEIEYPYQVPDKRYFVLGDNRRDSIDSRSHEVGTVTNEQVVGKVLFRVLLPWSD